MPPLERFFPALSSLNDSIDFVSDDDVLQANDLWVDPPRRPSSRKKQVQFCETVTIVRVPSMKQLPANVKTTMWYQKKDFNRFRESCRELQERLEAGYPSTARNNNGGDDEAECCTRGLEKFSRAGAMQYLDRQARMMNDFYLVRVTGGSPDDLSRLLISHTTVCQLEALERARKDERDSLLYHMKSVHSSADSLLISNLLPKVRNLLDRHTTSSFTDGSTSTTKKKNPTTTKKSCLAPPSTSAQARQMRQQRLSSDNRWSW